MVALGLLVRNNLIERRGGTMGDRERRALVQCDGLCESLMDRAACQHLYFLRWRRLMASNIDVNTSYVNVDLCRGLTWPLPKDDEHGYAD
jgi:hypothetical protein